MASKHDRIRQAIDPEGQSPLPGMVTASRLVRQLPRGRGTASSLTGGYWAQPVGALLEDLSGARVYQRHLQ
jgi:hypothetical protein